MPDNWKYCRRGADPSKNESGRTGGVSSCDKSLDYRQLREWYLHRGQDLLHLQTRKAQEGDFTYALQ